MTQGRRARGALSLVALAGAAAAVLTLRQATPSCFLTPSSSLAAGWPAEAVAVPRGEALPRTQMQAKKKNTDRTRIQGGGRQPVRVNRSPVLGYSITTENANGMVTEQAGSVLRRMYDMAEMDFNKMAGMRDRYWRPGYRKSKWVADYNMRSGRKKKEAKLRRQYETDWQEWMSTVGRQRGLTDPVLFNGPPLKLSEEDDAATDPKVFSKKIPSENELATEMKLPRGKDLLPEDVQPGKFNCDGEDSIFKIWKRPLHKHPYDIGKRGKIGPVVRGIVL